MILCPAAVYVYPLIYFTCLVVWPKNSRTIVLYWIMLLRIDIFIQIYVLVEFLQFFCIHNDVSMYLSHVYWLLNVPFLSRFLSFDLWTNVFYWCISMAFTLHFLIWCVTSVDLYILKNHNITGVNSTQFSWMIFLCEFGFDLLVYSYFIYVHQGH